VECPYPEYESDDFHEKSHIHNYGRILQIQTEEGTCTAKVVCVTPKAAAELELLSNKISSDNMMRKRTYPIHNGKKLILILILL
jgi:hypothetical protein